MISPRLQNHELEFGENPGNWLVPGPLDYRELAEGFHWDKNICLNTGTEKPLPKPMTY